MKKENNNQQNERKETRVFKDVKQQLKKARTSATAGYLVKSLEATEEAVKGLKEILGIGGKNQNTV